MLMGRANDTPRSIVQVSIAINRNGGVVVTNQLVNLSRHTSTPYENVLRSVQLEPRYWGGILGDPGAVSRVAGIFVGESLL